MGINFLNVPIQPRWDSPQDMFGFYNYLENKYRATELSRALIQMDRFWNVGGRGWQGCPRDWQDKTLSEQMLLVLVDEMNLARVEYYFSEFLSRLEVRPNIRKDDTVDREKAEIPLEIGMTTEEKNSSPIMRLFVDTNVLVDQVTSEIMGTTNAAGRNCSLPVQFAGYLLLFPPFSKQMILLSGHLL